MMLGFGNNKSFIKSMTISTPRTSSACTCPTNKTLGSSSLRLALSEILIASIGKFSCVENPIVSTFTKLLMLSILLNESR